MTDPAALEWLAKVCVILEAELRYQRRAAGRDVSTIRLIAQPDMTIRISCDEVEREKEQRPSG